MEACDPGAGAEFEGNKHSHQPAAEHQQPVGALPEEPSGAYSQPQASTTMGAEP